MINNLNKYQRILLLLFSTFLVLLLLGISELILQFWFPYNPSTIGHIYTKKAEKYGWGFTPQERVVIKNPDTGENYISYTNNHGWRDIDHRISNKSDSFRILVIGDSNTFGAIVPKHKIYTRVLADSLQSKGLNVEVINMGYGGFSTDQELEVLMTEGGKYNPDLVIFQFTDNDLITPGKPDTMGYQRYKPFYYTLNQNGKPVKNKNKDAINRLKRSRSKSSIFPSTSELELYKRAKGFYLILRNSVRGYSGYRLIGKKIELIKTNLNLDEKHPFIQKLRANVGIQLTKSRILEWIDDYNIKKDKNFILRLFEYHWFDNYWDKNQYCPKIPDTNSTKWKLYFGLMRKAQKYVEENTADIAIVSDLEKGHYNFDRYWGRVSPKDSCKSNYLRPTGIIKNFANQNGIGFIENHYIHKRAMNDPHPNIEGNIAIARNILVYLRKNYSNKLN